VRAEDASKTIRGVDGLLLPLGFKRRARSQEWGKSTGADREWVHLNFGKSVTIHPSFGVQYRDLLQVIPELPGPVDGTVRMLSSLFHPSRQYSSEDPPEPLIGDIRDTDCPALLRCGTEKASSSSCEHRWLRLGRFLLTLTGSGFCRCCWPGLGESMRRWMRQRLSSRSPSVEIR